MACMHAASVSLAACQDYMQRCGLRSRSCCVMRCGVVLHACMARSGHASGASVGGGGTLAPLPSGPGQGPGHNSDPLAQVRPAPPRPACMHVSRVALWKTSTKNGLLCRHAPCPAMHAPALPRMPSRCRMTMRVGMPLDRGGAGCLPRAHCPGLPRWGMHVV